MRNWVWFRNGGGEGLRARGGLRADAPSEARSADGSRAGRRPPAHTAAGPGARNTRGATSNNTRAQTARGRAGHAAAGDQAGQQTTSRKTAAHGHIEQPGPQDSTPGARNTSGATQQTKPQKPNEKYPHKQQHSQLHSSMPKSHMRNMRAS